MVDMAGGEYDNGCTYMRQPWYQGYTGECEKGNVHHRRHCQCRSAHSGDASLVATLALDLDARRRLRRRITSFMGGQG